MNRFNVALLQIDTQNNKAANLKKIGTFIDDAAAKGADFISLPEMCSFIGKSTAEAIANTEPVPGPTTSFMAAKARERGVWLHGGSIYEAIRFPEKIGPITPYRKIHLFDVEVAGGVSHKESRTVRPGGEKFPSSTPNTAKWGSPSATMCASPSCTATAGRRRMFGSPLYKEAA